MSEQDTKTRILKAAEELITREGAAKASLRRITDLAGVNIAAINYHFGSKNALVSAIIERLLSPLVEETLEKLQRLVDESPGGRPAVADVVRCKLTVLLDYSRKHPNHKTVFMQLFQHYDDELTFRQAIRQVIEREIRFLGETFVRALPQVPEPLVLVRVAFFRNACFGIMKGDCIMEESREVLGFSFDDQELLEAMVAFFTAAFSAPAGI